MTEIVSSVDAGGNEGFTKRIKVIKFYDVAELTDSKVYLYSAFRPTKEWLQFRKKDPDANIFPPPGTNNHVMLVVGKTGAGKTTLIETLMNFQLGVKWEDDVRYTINESSEPKDQSESQTDSINGYVFLNETGGFTIIDTPGFGDTRKIDLDEQIPGKIASFLKAFKCTKLAAICFVVHASLNRLTAEEEKIMQDVLALFSKDMRDNVFICFTHNDGEELPADALHAVGKSGVPCEKAFAFNNKATFAGTKNGDKISKYHKLQWGDSLETRGEMMNTMKSTKAEIIDTTEIIDARENMKEKPKLLKRALDECLQKINDLNDEINTLNVNKTKSVKELLAKMEELVEQKYTEKKNEETLSWNINCETCKSSCCIGCSSWTVVSCSIMSLNAFTWMCNKCHCQKGCHHFQQNVWRNEEKTRWVKFEEKLKLKDDVSLVETNVGKEVLNIREAIEKKAAEQEIVQKNARAKARSLLVELHQSMSVVKKKGFAAVIQNQSINMGEFLQSLIDDENKEEKQGYAARVKEYKAIVEDYKNKPGDFENTAVATGGSKSSVDRPVLKINEAFFR